MPFKNQTKKTIGLLFLLCLSSGSLMAQTSMNGGGYSLRGGTTSISSGYSVGGDYKLSTSTRAIAGLNNATPFLDVGFVDSSGFNVLSPSVLLGSKPFSLADSVISGVLGVPEERLRVTNISNNDLWTVSIAAEDPLDLWTGAVTGAEYDFNDPTIASADGGDTDLFGGQLDIDPSSGSISPESGCASTGISLGSSASFEEGVVDSITLLSSDVTAEVDCYWELTDVSLTQGIPAEQSVDEYSIDMVVSIIAN